MLKDGILIFLIDLYNNDNFYFMHKCNYFLKECFYEEKSFIA